MALTGKGLAKFAASKAGTPYVYGAKGADGPLTQARVNWLAAHYPNVFTAGYLKKIKDRHYVGQVCCDCSGLISWYTGKVLGSSQLYNQAKARLPMSQLDKFAIGTVLYRQGHVGVYCGLNSKGQHILMEAKGIDHGTVCSIVNPAKWKCGLTFSWIDYSIDYPIDSNLITYKGINPYKEPTGIIKAGSSGEAVRWLQFELIESGYGYEFSYNHEKHNPVVISGNFDKDTKAAVLSFQTSSKLEVDGIVGPATKKALNSEYDRKIREGKNTYPIPTKYLKINSKGTYVLWLQTQLYIKGYSLIPTGIFDSVTAAYVRDFQKKNKLEIDGVVGPLTIKALLN